MTQNPPISLRPLTIDDAPTMFEVLADERLHAFTGGSPPTLDELRARYAVQGRGQSSDGTQLWVNDLVLLGGRPIGYVQATIPTAGGATEIAWVIGQAWQGRGYATRAVRLLVAELAARGVDELIAHIHPDHVTSARVAQKVGLGPTGVVIDGEVRWSNTVDATTT